MTAMARGFHDKFPSHLRWMASSLIHLYQFYLFIMKLKLKIRILTGKERNSQMPLSILYAASDRNTEPVINIKFFLELIFDEYHEETYLGCIWMWALQKVIRARGQHCPLMVVQVYEPFRYLIKPNNFFYIPLWVVGEVDIPDDSGFSAKRSAKTDLRRIREQALNFEVTHDPRLFDDFYYNMYQPYIDMTHRSKAYIVPYDTMRKKFSNCDLLLITRQSERIAGALILYEKAGPRL